MKKRDGRRCTANVFYTLTSRLFHSSLRLLTFLLMSLPCVLFHFFPSTKPQSHTREIIHAAELCGEHCGENKKVNFSAYSSPPPILQHVQIMQKDFARCSQGDMLQSRHSISTCWSILSPTKPLPQGPFGPINIFTRKDKSAEQCWEKNRLTLYIA